MKYHFGDKIREVRERRGLTLKEAALRAGVSESLVSQIERNKVSPAVDTLLNLAESVGIDFEYLFADYRREQAVKVVRKSERSSFSTRPGVHYERLALMQSPDKGGIEAYILTIEPGAKTGSQEVGHPGWEMGLVVAGKVRLSVGHQEYTLMKNDSVSFASETPHTLACEGEEKTVLFWVTTPPKGENRL
jgi:transcriptional regulator with XRE-family HTH domain